MNDIRHTVGIDLGGTQLRVACVDADGKVLSLERERSDQHPSPADLIERMIAMIARVRSPATTAIGCAIPGLIDRRNGIVLGIPAFAGWSGVPLAPILRDRTGLPAQLENDANVAAIGEWRCGAGRGSVDLAYVTISTGIGAGIISDGRLVRGHGGLAGEIGHTRISDEPAICSCGRSGCFEAMAAGRALDRRVAGAVTEHPSSLLAQIVGTRTPGAEYLGHAAARGCHVSLEILDAEAYWLGLGFTNLQHLYSPARIVMGGGVSALLPQMRERINGIMRERLLPGFTLAAIESAALGDTAGVVGAAILAREAL
jgi:glucokinase